MWGGVMRIHVAGALAAAGMLTCSSAFAADLASPPEIPAAVAYDWTGFYGGVHVGYGWGDSEISDVVLTKGWYKWWKEEWKYSDYDLGDLDEFDVDGVLGGLQAGYNFQNGSFVFGLEADVSISGINGDDELVSLVAGDFNFLTAGVETDVDWLATFRGRVGFAFDRFLVYATGGLAVAGVETSLYANSDLFGGFSETWSDENTHFGYTVGGGLEAFLTQNLSVKAEYLYIDLGDENYSANIIDGDYLSVDVSGDVDVTLNVVKVGLNYHF